ncbi:MAG: argininosuccinate lyase [Planctomycetes bacterium]|nr:argininosuccinate lyase [Planctomycetota bacterium]
MTLWGELHSEPPDAHFAAFSSSFACDRRLLPYDLEGSRAWAFALARIGILTKKDVQQIGRGLRAIGKRARAEPGWLDQHAEEDVHSFVEARLHELIGDAAWRLHTGRSRNDQVALDVRLYVRDVGRQLQRALADYAFELLRFGERHPDVILPGYTHLRRAQPILLPHYALAYVEMALRDLERVGQARKRADVLPLGSAALAGTAYRVDRERLARSLRFADCTDNSLDAVSDRDFLVDLLYACTMTGLHLSRLCEDLILYSSQEFGFFAMGDDVSTGSSLMPQKRNPDACELVRGKSGRLVGNLNALLVLLKGLPLSYNRDLQEDKERLFDSVDTTLASLRVMKTVVAGLKVDVAACRTAAAGGFSNATDLADYLVRKGVPFRMAHRHVSRVVRECTEAGLTLETLPIERYRAICDVFAPDLYEQLTLDAVLSARAVRGGTAPLAVHPAMKRAQKRILRALGSPA